MGLVFLLGGVIAIGLNLAGLDWFFAGYALGFGIGVIVCVGFIVLLRIEQEERDG